MRTLQAQTLLAVALTASSISLPAQNPDLLVGLTRVAPSLRLFDFSNCGPGTTCPVPLPGVAILPPFAGGTGWDPVRPGAWITNGIQLAKVDDNCNLACPPVPIMMAANAFATGIDVVESQNMVLVIDSAGFLHSYTNTCPPNPIGVCNTGLGPVGLVTTGLATDEGNGLVFISYSDFATDVNRIVVSQLANPCNILCQRPVNPPCANFGAITGLACDWGNEVLYATDGVNTIAIRYSVGAVCVTLGPIQCCTPPVAVLDPMVGLAIRPARAIAHGQECANGICPPCPMNHFLANDPSLGNAAFALRLENAPAQSLAWCLIGAGPCQLPGLSVLPLCGPVHTIPLLGTLGPIPTGGAAPCQGDAAFHFPLPAWPGLAGWTISSQCAVLCANPLGIGTSLSKCLEFTLQGN